MFISYYCSVKRGQFDFEYMHLYVQFREVSLFTDLKNLAISFKIEELLNETN